MLCARHRDAQAFWECTRCGRWHCEACIRVVRTGTGALAHSHLKACSHCDGVLREAARQLPSQREDLAQLLGRLGTGEAVVTAVALALPAWLAQAVSVVSLPFAGAILQAVYFAGIASYTFLVVDHVGRGRPGLPSPSDVDDFWEMLVLMVRGLVCVLVGFAPLLVYVVATVYRGLGSEMPALTSRPLLVLGLLALGYLYVPALVLAVAITDRTLAAFWPPAWIRIIGRAPAAYGRLLGLVFASLLAWWIGNLAAATLFGRVPIFGGLLITTVSNLLWFAQGLLLGGHLARHADELGVT